MAKVFLGVGSNIEAAQHIHRALVALEQRFGKLDVSPIYESEAIGFSGDNFLNLVVGISTSLTVGELYEALREIENNNGRDRSAPKFSGRTLDIDILLYDDLAGEIDGVVLPRDEIIKNAFVLRPLFDLAPDLIHPQYRKTITQMWGEYDHNKQKLWQVELP
jgi:2-amino-4-hydroxy-6-hydroxymethyldihydropteridine diphosphokinase